jgi:hypothetical protein
MYSLSEAKEKSNFDRYYTANPIIDSKNEISKNNLKFKALLTEGTDPVIYVPGKEYFEDTISDNQVEIIKTHSTWSCNYECQKLTAIAEVYAKNYNIIIAKEIQKRKISRIETQMAGYSEFIKFNRITQHMTGLINELPESYHADITSQKYKFVKHAWWFNPLENGVPKFNWTQFLEVYKSVDSIVGEQLWLINWLNEDSTRYAEAEIFGITPKTDIDTVFGSMSAWKLANLEDEPYYEIYLRRKDNWIGTIHIAKNSSNSLITNLWPDECKNSSILDPFMKPQKITRKKSGHWLNSIPGYNYHPSDSIPKFVKVDRNGKWESSWSDK